MMVATSNHTFDFLCPLESPTFPVLESGHGKGLARVYRCALAPSVGDESADERVLLLHGAILPSMTVAGLSPHNNMELAFG
jgi:hypothetical protein